MRNILSDNLRRISRSIAKRIETTTSREMTVEKHAVFGHIIRTKSPSAADRGIDLVVWVPQ